MAAICSTAFVEAALAERLVLDLLEALPHLFELLRREQLLPRGEHDGVLARRALLVHACERLERARERLGVGDADRGAGDGEQVLGDLAPALVLRDEHVDFSAGKRCLPRAASRGSPPRTRERAWRSSAAPPPEAMPRSCAAATPLPDRRRARGDQRAGTGKVKNALLSLARPWRPPAYENSKTRYGARSTGTATLRTAVPPAVKPFSAP